MHQYLQNMLVISSLPFFIYRWLVSILISKLIIWWGLFFQFVRDHYWQFRIAQLILLRPSPPLPSHRKYVIVLVKCRPLHWCSHHLCLHTGSTWSRLQSADPLADAVTVFAFPQDVRDCACKVQTPLLMLSPSLPSHRMYVIVLAKCRPPHWCCHHLCLPTGSMWLCLQSADPLADAITAFAFP